MPFPPGNPGDYFLIIDPNGSPAYLVTRQQLEASTLQHNTAYHAAEFAYRNSNQAALPVDDVANTATIHTYNRTRTFP